MVGSNSSMWFNILVNQNRKDIIWIDASKVFDKILD
jgi:hypothetical protein